MFKAPVLSELAVFTVSAIEASGAAFQSGSVCNTRTLCNGLQS